MSYPYVRVRPGIVPPLYLYLTLGPCRYLGTPKPLASRIDQYFNYLTTYSHPGPDGMGLVGQLPSSMYQVGP